MSGSKRRSAYRKNVTDEVMYAMPEPAENEQVVQVLHLLGTNLMKVSQAAPP
jgi:hypothetical protein